MTVWPFFDGDDTKVCGLTFSNTGSLSTDFLLATGELPEDEGDDVAAAAFLASTNILETSLDASGDLLSSLSDVLLLIEVLFALEVDGLFVGVPAPCFLENAE